MVRKLVSLCGAVIMVALVSPSMAAGAGGSDYDGPVPLPETGALFGAYVAPDGYNGDDRREALLNFETLVGRRMAIERVYYNWEEAFPTADDEWSRDLGRTLYMSWNASREDTGSCTPWADIAAGLHDADIDARAAGIKAFGAPLIFSFHHEPTTRPPDGVSCGTPEEYIAAWQRVRDRFEAEGVTNVSYAITFTAQNFDTQRADDFYPGDSYVDIVGAAGYNWYRCNHPGTETWSVFEQIFQRFHEFGVTHQKPLIVAEYGTGEDPEVEGRKAQWFTDAADVLKSWPEIKGVSYFNVGFSCPRYVDTSQSSLAAFRANGADPYFNPPVATVPISVADFSFSPRSAPLRRGIAAEWTFNGPSDHTVTDNSGMGLYDSGIQAAGSTYPFYFIAAGSYSYRCTIHGAMTGVVKVPAGVSPSRGDLDTEFTVTWAANRAPTGYAFDVQIRRPGAPSWEDWLTLQTPNMGTFVPDAGVGKYRFRARYHNTTNDATSGYSRAAVILVTSS